LALLTVPGLAQAPGGSTEKQSPPVAEQPKPADTVPRPASPAPSCDDVPEPEQPVCGEGDLLPGWADQLDAMENPAARGKLGRGHTGQLKDTGARWACDKTTVFAEPVWSGQPVTCTFTMRNEGTGELIVKARGG